MNDHEFDLSLKQRASTEADPVPAGFEDRLQAAVDQLPERTVAKRSSRNILRPVLVAAVLAVGLLGTVLAATSRFDFVELYNKGEKTIVSENEEEEDLELLYLITPNGMVHFPVEDLPQSVRDAAARSTRPSTYLYPDSWSAARDLLGLELLSNTVLEESGELIRFGMGKSMMTDGCLVELSGSGPNIICVIAAYQLGEEDVTLRATAVTDASGSDGVPSYGMIAGDDHDSAATEEYVTASGVEAIIMTNNWSGELKTVMGYFTQNGIHYNLRVCSPEKEHCVQTMKEVLDGFQ